MAEIALLPEPIPARCSMSKGTTEPALLLGLDRQSALIVDAAGWLSWVPIGDVETDWRYDNHSAEWVDAGIATEED